jgi:hypothetical protein
MAIISFKVEGMDRLKRWVEGMPRQMHQGLREGLWQWGLYAFELSQDACPVDSGILRASGYCHMENDEIFLMGYTADYARDVEFGTAAHRIDATNRKSLAFPMAGARLGMRKGKPVSIFKFGGKTTIAPVVFAKHVYHPGTRAQSFLIVPFEEAKPFLKQYLTTYVIQAIKG